MAAAAPPSPTMRPIAHRTTRAAKRTAGGWPAGPVLDRGQQNPARIAAVNPKIISWLCQEMPRQPGISGHRLVVVEGPPRHQRHRRDAAQEEERPEAFLEDDVIRHWGILVES